MDHFKRPACENRFRLWQCSHDRRDPRTLRTNDSLSAHLGRLRASAGSYGLNDKQRDAPDGNRHADGGCPPRATIEKVERFVLFLLLFTLPLGLNATGRALISDNLWGAVGSYLLGSVFFLLSIEIVDSIAFGCSGWRGRRRF